MLYNDYRPKDFNDVVGQEQNLLTLAKQVETGRLSQAYLFAGHRGTGKTTIARILSRGANCQNPTGSGPCNVCDNCRMVLENKSMDVIELDGASNNGVDEIRNLIGQTNYQPVTLPKKIFIIDEVHNLSASAFDALLKTLEEPPEYCIFLLCTTELHKIPPTIISRCELYEFKSISSQVIIERLKYVLNDLKMTSDEDSLKLIAKASNGALRDALGILEQMLASSDGRITVDLTKKRLGITEVDSIFRILNDILGWETAKTLADLEDVIQKGNIKVFLNSLLETITDLIVLACCQDSKVILNDQDYIRQLKECLENTEIDYLYRLMEEMSSLRESIRSSIDPAMEVRLCMTKCSCRELIASDMGAMSLALKEQRREIEVLKQEISLLKNSKNDSGQDKDHGFEGIVDESSIPFPEEKNDPEAEMLDQTYEEAASSEENLLNSGEVIKTDSDSNLSDDGLKKAPDEIEDLLDLLCI